MHKLLTQQLGLEQSMARNNKYYRCSTVLLKCYDKLNSHRQTHLLEPQCPSEAQALALNV